MSDKRTKKTEISITLPESGVELNLQPAKIEDFPAPDKLDHNECMRRALVRDPKYFTEANAIAKAIIEAGEQPFSWDLVHNVPMATEAAYDRAVEIYNELRDGKLAGGQRVALLAEMQQITNSGVLLYALERHHGDVE